MATKLKKLEIAESKSEKVVEVAMDDLELRKADSALDLAEKEELEIGLHSFDAYTS